MYQTHSATTFSIFDHVEKLEPAREKGKYHCPVCGDDNFSFSQDGAFSCWSTGCDSKAIMDALAPLPERSSHNAAPDFRDKRKPRAKKKSRKERQRDTQLSAAMVEAKVDELALMVAEGIHTLEQAQVELSAWCKEEKHDYYAASQLFKAKASELNLQPTSGKKKAPQQSEIATVLAEKYRERLAYDSHQEEWFHYGKTKDGVWDFMPPASMERMIQAELDAFEGVEGYSSGMVSGILTLLRGRLEITKWEERSELLPFTNGVLDTFTGKFLEHSPGYGLRWQLPRAYSSVLLQDGFPKINAYLDQATQGNPELKNILLCTLNAILRGRADLQRFLHLMGPGGTGKGTFLRLATALIGEENTHYSTLQAMCGNNFEVANLDAKRLVVFADEDRFGGNLGIFKQLTGGDHLRAERKHKDAYLFKFNGIALMASNYPVFVGDASSGLARRCLTVPFTHRILASQRQTDLGKDLESELTALTAYLLQMSDALVTQTLLGITGQSQEVVELTWEARIQTDSVTAWLNECVVKRPAAEGWSEQVGSDKENQQTLFGSYYQWCKRTGAEPVKLPKFSPRLIDLATAIIGWDDVQKTRMAGSGRTLITGLKLRTESDFETGPIDALVEASGVKGEGSREGLCEGLCEGLEPLHSKDCEGCEGLEEVSVHRNNSEANLSLLPNENQPQLETQPEGLKNMVCNPSHPSQALQTGALSPSQRPSPDPSQSPPSPSQLDGVELVRMYNLLDELSVCRAWESVVTVGRRYVQTVKQAAWDYLRLSKPSEYERLWALKPC